MILIDENEIGTISTDQFVNNRIICLEQLDFNLTFDLILDCSKTILPIEDLLQLELLLLKKSRILVVVVSKEKIDSLPNELNVVPTSSEANDFISFERIQRDLGF
tara:strand:- start:435 stop:749 length:315 start_codon:yes stop_codon:yes gene_type:complete